MKNKVFASLTIWIVLGFIGIWAEQFAVKFVDSWSIGYITGVLSFSALYIHKEFSE